MRLKFVSVLFHNYIYGLPLIVDYFLKFQIILLSFKFVVFASTETHFPKVYEDLNEGLSSESVRQIRQLNDQSSNLKVHQAFSPFNYFSALQQDQRKFRYILQQIADTNSMLRKKAVVIKSQLANHKGRSNSKLYQNSLPLSSTATKRSTKTTDQTIGKNLDVLKKENINRQDEYSGDNKQIVYVDPEILKQNFGFDPKVAEEIIFKAAPNNMPGSEHDLNALHQLIGQNPNIQLEGLQKLLQANFVEARVNPESGSRDHTPITEQTADIPNKQMRPNIHVNYKNQQPQSAQSEQLMPVKIHSQALDAIQAHLDAASQAQASRAIARAEQHALAHVEAQHKAIAKAKIDAEKKALAQIAAQNQAYGHPTQSFNVIQVPVNYQEQTHHQEHQNPLALSLKSEMQQPNSNVNYLPSNHQDPVLEHLQVDKAVLAQNNAFIHQQNQHFLKDIQSNPVQQYSHHQFEKSKTQDHQIPTRAYQEVVLETQHERKNIKTIYPAEQKKLNHHHQHEESDDNVSLLFCNKSNKINCLKIIRKLLLNHSIKKRSNANDAPVDSDDSAEYYDDDTNLNDTLDSDYYDYDSIQNSSNNFQKHSDSFEVPHNDTLVDMSKNFDNIQPEALRRYRPKKRRLNRNRNRKYKLTTTVAKHHNHNYDVNSDSRFRPLISNAGPQLIISSPDSSGLGKKHHDSSNVIVINNSNQNYETNSYLPHNDGHHYRNRVKHISQRFKHSKRSNPNRRLKVKKILKITDKINNVLSNL